jgi:hypothetical protein
VDVVGIIYEVDGTRMSRRDIWDIMDQAAGWEKLRCFIMACEVFLTPGVDP